MGDLGAALGPIDARWLRRFEDGVAVFDPVTWQTHVLSSDGLELLGAILEVAQSCAGDAHAVRERLVAEFDGELDLEVVSTWVRLACHLVQGSCAAHGLIGCHSR